jgi:excinuclease ABC subunit C
MLTLEQIKQLNIPSQSGSYQFCVQGGQIVYIGKAVNLQKRIYSYWQRYHDLTLAKQQMINEIKTIKWLVTDSEIEALLLEANLIKKYQPQYNIVWRDDKRYCYIAVSADEFPRIYSTRKLESAGQFFGPFTSTQAVRETLRLIRKIWPYRSCRNLTARACLYYRINQCPGPCQQFISVVDYKKNIENIVLFLQGEKKSVVKNIQAERDNYQRQLAKMIKQAEKQGNNDDIAIIEQKISSLNWQLRQLEQVLANNHILGLEEKYANDVVEVAKLLGFAKPPQRIEGYDLSNLYNKQAVGSLVVFMAGEADPSQYKRFKLAGVETTSSLGDIALLREMLIRRLAHHDWPRPDLIVVDGAKAQANIARRLLDRAGWDIPVIGLGKDKGLRSARALDKLFFPGQKQALQLSLNNPALHLLKRVRDEAHRFALAYHRQVRKREFWE